MRDKIILVQNINIKTNYHEIKDTRAEEQKTICPMTPSFCSGSRLAVKFTLGSILAGLICVLVERSELTKFGKFLNADSRMAQLAKEAGSMTKGMRAKTKTKIVKTADIIKNSIPQIKGSATKNPTPVIKPTPAVKKPIREISKLTLSDGSTPHIKMLTHNNLKLTIDMKLLKNPKFEAKQINAESLEFTINGKKFTYYVDKYSQTPTLVTKDKKLVMTGNENTTEITIQPDGNFTFDSTGCCLGAMN